VRSVVRGVVIFLVLVLAYPSWLALQVWQQSREDEPRAADAIVVLGAAQYNGKPSPVFKARLDHARYLYEQDLSDTVIVTGGKAAGDRYTESAAGRAYLGANGVPEEHIVEEGAGRTTFQSLRNVWDLASDRGIDTVLLVSDPMHSERIKRMAEDLGFERSYASPANYETLNRSRTTKVKELLHEVASLIVYQVAGR